MPPEVSCGPPREGAQPGGEEGVAAINGGWVRAGSAQQCEWGSSVSRGGGGSGVPQPAGRRAPRGRLWGCLAAELPVVTGLSSPEHSRFLAGFVPKRCFKT